MNTGVLIVDEVLMLSLKVFDTLEYVCRRLRNKNTYFGSLQVIALSKIFSNCYQCLIIKMVIEEGTITG